MAQRGLPRPLFSGDMFRGRRKRKLQRPEGLMDAGGAGGAPPWVEGWSRPPPPRRTRWGPELPQAEGPGMSPPGWGNPGQGPPPPWGRNFPPREGREGPWRPPQDPPWGEWGSPPGAEKGANEGPWDRPGPQRWEGPPSRGSRWEGNEQAGGPPGRMEWGPGGPGNGGDRWGNRPKWDGPEDPGNWDQPPGNWDQHPGESFPRNPGRNKLANTERRRGEPQSHGRENRNWGNPETSQPSSDCDKRGWGPNQREPREQPSGSRGQPARGQFYTDSARNEGRWRDMERGGEECQAPDGARGQNNPTEDHRSWGGPETECSRSGNQPGWEQSSSNPRGGGNNIPKMREREFPSANTGRREWDCPEISNKQPSSDVQQDYSGSVRSVEEENPDDNQRDTEMCEQEIKEEHSDAEEGSLERCGSPAPSNSGAPKQWTPRSKVVHWWMRSQAILKTKVRQQFLSVCPRPTLPDGTSETPCLNGGILNLLGKQQMTELVSGSLTLWQVQDEVLDMLAPLLTIYEIAEEALEGDKLVDPIELREWVRQIVRHVGSINHRLTLHRRLQLLSLINPRLKTLSSKLIGRSTNGMLFAEDKAKLLLEILKQFPQLATNNMKQSAKKKPPFKYTPAYKRKQTNTTSQPHYRGRSRGSKSYKPFTVNWSAEQNHQ